MAYDYKGIRRTVPPYRTRAYLYAAITYTYRSTYR